MAYPIIEPGTVIEWENEGRIEDKVIVKKLSSDKDGDVQVQIEETAPDTKESPRTIALEDLHDQLEWRDYSVSHL